MLYIASVVCGNSVLLWTSTEASSMLVLLTVIIFQSGREHSTSKQHVIVPQWVEP